jgi:hypothetical protein
VAPLAGRLLDRHGYHVGASVLTVEGVCAECHDTDATVAPPATD